MQPVIVFPVFRGAQGEPGLLAKNPAVFRIETGKRTAESQRGADARFAAQDLVHSDSHAGQCTA